MHLRRNQGHPSPASPAAGRDGGAARLGRAGTGRETPSRLRGTSSFAHHFAGTLTLLLATLTSAFGQANQRPSPRLGYVYPAGGQQGTTVTVSVGGQNLIGASAAFFSTSGIEVKVVGHERPLTQKELNDLREKAQLLQEKKRAAARANASAPAFTAEDEKAAEDIRHLIATRGNRQATPAVAETVTLQLTLAPDVPTGEHEFRLRSTAGLSNPLVFCVGQLPENTAPVITATSARGPQRGRVSDPRIRSRDEREVALPAVLNGQVLPGETDRFRFTAKQGQRLTFAVAARSLLPYLADAVPGWFQATLAVYDGKGRELGYADDFRFNPDPVLVCEIPADGTYTLEIKDAIYRGREDFVYRITAGELPFVTSIFPLGGAIGERVSFAVKGWNLPLAKLEIDAREKAPGTYLLSVREHGVQSNTVRFALDARAPLLESAAATRGATPLALPALVDGQIEKAGNEDTFSFIGTRGSEIVAEVYARRFGSPLDSMLTLNDANGQRLASNDDSDDKGAGLLTHHADSRIAVTLPADGTYTIRLTDAQGRGSPDHGYRLRIGPPEPDFELRVVPSTINLRAGATVPITVYALRRDGFAGEIVLGLQNAPTGLALSGARIPAHQDMVRLTLTAASNAREETRTLLVAGTASIGGRAVTHRAIPADDMMQAFAYRHLVAAKELRLCIAGRGSTPRLTSRIPARLRLDPLTRIRIATPAMKNVRNVTFELREPPPGITVQSVAQRGDSAEVVLSCDRSKMKPGQQGNLILEAYGERGNNSKATQRVQRSPLGTVPAIPFEVAADLAPAS